MFAADLESRPLPPDDYLSRDELRKLRGILVERARALIDHGKDSVHALTSEREREADAVDIAVSEATREFTLRVAGRERQMLGKIRYALNRIEQSEYGACESCGEAIGYKRQFARPVATRCIDCKTREEQLEGRKGAF